MFVRTINKLTNIMENILLSKLEIQNQNQFEQVFSEDLKEFLTALHNNFNTRRLALLENRRIQQAKFDNGDSPKFPSETEDIRTSNWTANPIPEALLDRRVEITGPVDRKMVINALNSGAKTFMADFEDSCSPTWANLMEGQINLRDAVNKTISLEQNGKTYQLNNSETVLLVRPRGLHLEEKNILINDEITSGSLVDFGIFFFLNAKKLIENGVGPYFYLPKLEHYYEARWWSNVFTFAENYLRLPIGTIKATVLIETITASFQLDEIIYELKEHMAGLNCGRWDYIFSYIKKLNKHEGFIVPDRDQITMTSPFMSAYSLRVIQICHKRNVLAIGGMAAQIPIKNNEEANQAAFNKVVADKEREVKNGHDGTWVAHPALVPLAMKVFNENMPTKNQMHIKRSELTISEAQLLEIPQGKITLEGIRKNVNVAILYIESWLIGVGAAALYHLMEDAATAEISRSQIWLWLHKKVTLATGETFTPELLELIIAEELDKIKDYVGAARYESGKFEMASQLFTEFSLSEVLDDFLTTKAYQYI
jgi:malate synthase